MQGTGLLLFASSLSLILQCGLFCLPMRWPLLCESDASVFAKYAES